MNIFKYFLLSVLLLGGLVRPALAASALPEDAHAGVILSYARVGEDEYPDNSVTTDQFLAHIEELTKGSYNILPLPTLIDALKKGDPLPPRTVAITFESAFRSAYLNAMPVLIAKKIPFTVFYAADFADSAADQYMDWKELKSVAAHPGVTLGVLPASYARLAEGTDEDIRRAVNRAKTRHREMLNAEAALFSYPYGEYSAAYKKIIADSGFAATFGSQSGVAYNGSDFYALPRFTMTGKYGDADRFKTVARALPFPVTDIEPPDSFLKSGAPSIGFTTTDALAPELKNIACFISGQPEPRAQVLGSRIELRAPDDMDEDRVRVNCTLPAPADASDDTPLYRWFGMLLSPPGDDAADDEDEDDDEIDDNPEKSSD